MTENCWAIAVADGLNLSKGGGVASHWIDVLVGEESVMILCKTLLSCICGNDIDIPENVSYN